MKVICISGKAQHGKDTSAGLLKMMLEADGYKVLIAHYGDLVKYICKTFFDWNGEKDVYGRSLLQRIGTDVIRKQEPDYWVSFVADILKFFDGEWDYVLIPDSRFPNEVNYLKDRGFDVTHMRVIRQNFISPLTPEQQNHPSETALDDVLPDHYINNYGTLDDLRDTISGLITEINGCHQISFAEIGVNQMFVDIYDTDRKFDLIVADPPWKQSKGGKKSVRKNSSGEPLDYPVCTLEEIKEHLAKANEHTEDNAVLFLWTIDKYLFEAEQIARDLGYKLHARMVWNKVTGIPAAFTIRFGHEYLLYMYKGKLLPVDKDERGKIHSVFTEQVKRHSQKPEVSFEIINRLYPDAKKIELYARKERDGFDCWGNEVAGYKGI